MLYPLSYEGGVRNPSGCPATAPTAGLIPMGAEAGGDRRIGRPLAPAGCSSEGLP